MSVTSCDIKSSLTKPLKNIVKALVVFLSRFATYDYLVTEIETTRKPNKICFNLMPLNLVCCMAVWKESDLMGQIHR